MLFWTTTTLPIAALYGLTIVCKALSEEEQIIHQKLNSSFGAWLVFMVLGQRIYQN